jgi:hypothetical protein
MHGVRKRFRPRQAGYVCDIEVNGKISCARVYDSMVPPASSFFKKN